MKASLSNYRQSPRKVRLVTNLVRGKKVGEAITILERLPKRAGAPVAKLLRSARASAAATTTDADQLIVKELTVNQGRTLKRFQPAARGSAHPVRKRSSHVVVLLSEKK